MNENKCIFYGTLRKPMYNYMRFLNRFGIANLYHEKTINIPGFDLYDLGPYPAAKPSSNSSLLVVDLFSVSDQVFKEIFTMESDAGYYEDLTNIDNQAYSIFLYNSEIDKDLLIQSGDWVSHYRKLKTNSTIHSNY